ncbi:MAG: amino acid ABC transporter permease [Clostridiales bacterium]|nr:amino acid ABC transporter permease [Clostridiales bacterium]
MLYDIWLNLIANNGWQRLLEGFALTLQVTLGGLVLGITFGFVLALMRISRLPPLRWLSTLYITVVRGTPTVLQLMIWVFVILNSPDIPRLLVGIIAFGANSAAYTCEIFRGGILAVDKGQTEAGRSLGLGSGKNMRLIVLPQAIKNSLPSLSNEFITLFKETSLLGFVAITDLTRAANQIRVVTFNAFVPLISAALIYLTVVIILTWALGKLERRLRKGDSR